MNEKFQAYVITIAGLPLSVSLANRCIESAKDWDLTVQPFPAVDKFSAVSTMKREGLKLNKNIYSQVSDVPIGDRGATVKGQWHLTTPELGCCLSHYQLWRQVMRTNTPTLVLEHDALIVAPIPDLPANACAMNFHESRAPSTIGYMITPAGARLAVDWARTYGLEPSDELLWRAALRKTSVPTHIGIVENSEDCVSTIQFTRSDPIHKDIHKTDPWGDFQNPSKNKVPMLNDAMDSVRAGLHRLRNILSI